MAEITRKKRGYKFTKKKQSKKGIVAFLLATFSMGVFVYVVMDSFSHAGNGSMYLGSAGVTSMLVALVALVEAFFSLREEETFKLFPYLSVMMSFLAAGIWIAIYVMGFLQTYGISF